MHAEVDNSSDFERNKFRLLWYDVTNKGIIIRHCPCAKKVVSDSLGLVDFAIGLVNSVFNLPDGQVMFFEEFDEQKNCEINSANVPANSHALGVSLTPTG